MSSALETRRSRPTLVNAGVGAIGFTAVLYLVQVVNALDHQRLDQYGVEPRTGQGLLGVLFAPLLHVSWTHLLDNTLPVVVLGFLVLASGIGAGLAATAFIWLVGGAALWVLGPGHTEIVGASGLVFGWLVYLVVRGVVSRRIGEIVLGLALLVVFGGVLLGVLPGTPGVSWQGHLLGAIAGALAAVLLTDSPRERAGAVR